MHKLKVSDIEKDKLDETKSSIRCVYSFNEPFYAIYGTDVGVSVQFADDPDKQQQQRADFAALAPLRGEINGLVDVWRTDPDAPQGDEARRPDKRLQAQKLQAKVRHYDRSVADALVVALTRDCASGQAVLQEIRDDLIAERTAQLRLLYLMIAGATAIVLITGAIEGAWLAAPHHNAFWGDTDLLWMGAGSGSVGAFFSITLALHTREFKPELLRLDNAIAAFVRVLIGGIAGTLLVALMSMHMVSIALGDASFGRTSPHGVAPALLPLIVAFIGGFIERLIPDLLRSANTIAVKDPAPSAPPRPAGGGNVGPAGGGGTLGAGGNTGGGGGKFETVAAGDAADDDQAPRDDQADAEACLAHAPVTDAEATPDNQLPAATGGVAQG